MSENRKSLIVKAAGIFLLTMFVYIPAMQAKWIWDDNLLITQYSVMQQKDALLTFWWPPRQPGMVPDYFPMTFTTMWIEWQLYKDLSDNVWPYPATGFHITNCVMHALAAILVWLVLRKLKVPGAYLAGLIFAVHPVNVASVAWICERKNTQSILFFLLSVIFYLNYDRSKALRWYIPSLLMFLLGMLTKASVAMTPVALLLCSWWRRQKGQEQKDDFISRDLASSFISKPADKDKGLARMRFIVADLIRTAPFFALAAGLSIVTINFQRGNAISGENIFLPGEGTWAWRLAMAGIVPWFYLLKDFFPAELLMIYPRWSINTAYPQWFLGMAGIAAAAVILFLYRRRSWAQAMIFALGFFLVMLFPVMGFFDMYYFVHSLVADHWQYLSIIGVIALVTGAAAWYCRNWTMPLRLLPIIAAVAVVVLFSVMSWELTKVYHDQEALWGYNLPRNPNAWMGQYNMGTTLGERAIATSDPNLRRQLFERALTHLEMASRLRPQDSLIQNNLGYTLSCLDRLHDAVEHYLRAIKLKSDNYQAYFNLGLAYKDMGSFDQANKAFEETQRKQPRFLDAYVQQGLVLVQAGKLPEAEEKFSMILRRNPNIPDILYDRGLVYLAMKQLDKAKADFEACIRLQPNHPLALYQLGSIAQAQGDTPRAVDLLMAAVLVQPNMVDARYRLGVVMMEAGRNADAVRQLTVVVDQKPNFVDAHANLGLALWRMGMVRDSIAHYNRALELKDDAVVILRDLSRILASPAAGDLRDTAKAAELAEKACQLTKFSDPELLDNLAAVYANIGRLDEAVATEQKVLELVSKSADKKKIEFVENRIKQLKSARSAGAGGNVVPS